MSSIDEYRINQAIKSEKVRVIDSLGQQIGILSIKDALTAAKQQGFDLVEIAPNTVPPVCKILDYNKFRFDERKKAKDLAKKNRESKVETKELWLRPVTEKHDVEVKVRHAKEFLNDGNKVRFIVKFKGREISHLDHGKKLLESILAELGEVKIESPITQAGKQLTLVVSSLIQKK